MNEFRTLYSLYSYSSYSVWKAFWTITYSELYVVVFLDIYGSNSFSLSEVSGIYVINVRFKSTRQFSAFEINVLASDSKEYTLRYKASKWIFIFIMVMRHFLVQAIFSLIVRIMLPRAIYFNLSTTKIPHDLDLLNSGCLERWIII